MSVRDVHRVQPSTNMKGAAIAGTALWALWRTQAVATPLSRRDEATMESDGLVAGAKIRGGLVERTLASRCAISHTLPNSIPSQARHVYVPASAPSPFFVVTSRIPGGVAGRPRRAVRADAGGPSAAVSGFCAPSRMGGDVEAKRHRRGDGITFCEPWPASLPFCPHPEQFPPRRRGRGEDGGGERRWLTWAGLA